MELSGYLKKESISFEEESIYLLAPLLPDSKYRDYIFVFTEKCKERSNTWKYEDRARNNMVTNVN